MKKLLLFLIMGFLALTMISCGSEVKYKDPETGEEKTVKIEETQDAKAVAESVEAIAASEVKVKTSNSYSFNLNLNGDLTLKQAESSMKVAPKGNVKVEVAFDKNAELENTTDVLKAASLYAEVKFEGTIPSSNGTSATLKESTAKVYLSDGVLYAKVNLDDTLLAYLGADLKDKIGGYNNKVVKLDLKDLLGEVLLSDEAKASIKDFIQGESSKTLAEIIGSDAKVSPDGIARLVDAYGLVISKVSGSKVTFQIDLDKVLAQGGASLNPSAGMASIMMSGLAGKFEVTLDVSDMQVVSLKITASAKEAAKKLMEGSLSLELNFGYSASPSKISSADKESAQDVSNLLPKDKGQDSEDE